MNETPISIDELLSEREWLTRLARRLVADSGAADDLVQETWLTALTRPPHHRRGIRGWLATVLRNRARDEWDRGKREDRRARRSTPAAPPDDPADIVARAELEQRVARLTLALPEPYRTTLVMRYHRGLSPGQIARRLGEPAGTVRSRLKRGHDLLRDRLDRESDGERRNWVIALLPLARRSIDVGGTAMLTLPLKLALVGIALFVSLTGAVALLAAPFDEPPDEPLPRMVVADVPPLPAPAPEEPDDPAEPEPAVEKHPLDQKVTVEFEERKLTSVLQFVTDSTGIPFTFTGGLDPDRKDHMVTLKATDITLRSMLDLICLTSGVKWRLTPDGAIQLAALPKPAATRTTQKERKWLGASNGMFGTPVRVEGRVPPVVDLPTADMAESLPAHLLERAIKITVGVDGTRFHGEEDITDDYTLWLLLLENPDAPVVIFADEKTPVARIRRLRSRAGPASTWLATRGGTGLCLRGGPKPAGDVVVQTRQRPRKFTNGVRDRKGVYQAFWRIHQANAGKTIVLHSSFDERATVSHLTIIANEAARFGWPLSGGLPVAPFTPTELYFQILSPQGTPIEKGEVPELQPSVALGRYPANVAPTESTSKRKVSRWFLIRGRKGHRNLRAEGGGASTWKAVNLGLRWLSLQQQGDGSFGEGGADTALVMLTFLAEGVGVRKELKEYVETLEAGMTWLEQTKASSGPATMALAEAYALTEDPRWLTAATEAVTKTRSGLALRIARLCGVPVTIPDAEVTGDSPTACLMKFLDGKRPWEDAELGRAIRQFTLPVKDDVSALTGLPSQLLHDSTLVAFQAGSGAWWHWLRAMKPALLSTQIPSGPEAGSWPRQEGTSQIRDTALNVATLAVFYRYARLFKR